MIAAIDWNVQSELIDGWATPNKYGLLFVTGLIIGFFVIKRMFKKEGIPESLLDKLLIYIVLSTIVGARLGHVFFYDWPAYKHDPISIFKIWEGGLASHGAAIAILIALYIFSKRVSKRPMLWILDRVAAPIAIAGCFIRLGNLVNHEIVGDPTNLPWGFRFSEFDKLTPEGFPMHPDMLVNGMNVARHPAQLYEAIFYLLTFALLMYLYWKTRSKYRMGIIFGTFMIVLWSGRLLIEFIKVGQTERDDVWALNTGQLLSIPLILAGVVILVMGLRRKEELPVPEEDTPVSGE